MRRTLLTLAVSGLLLTATACGTAKSPDSGTPNVPGKTAAAGTGAADKALAETRAVCEALGKVYGQDIGPFAESLSKMVTDRKDPAGAKASQAQAQRTLGTFAKAVLGATQSSTDPQVRADGAKTAGTLQAKSADSAFFGKIQTSKDVETLLGPTLKEWMLPVTHHCS